MNNIRPHLTMLTEEQNTISIAIHYRYLQPRRARGLAVRFGDVEERVGNSNVEDRTVRIPKELVEWAINAAPKADPDV